MRIPKQPYTFDSFVNYLIDHSDEVFEDEDNKKWLKVYCILATGDEALYKLFSGCKIETMGDVREVTMGVQDDSDWEEKYYVVMRGSGLALAFTSAIQESFAKTLGDRIRRTRGVDMMWARRDLFNEVVEELLKESKGFVKRFTTRRSRFDQEECAIRPRYDRRFSYTGEDGSLVLRELKEAYGVYPESVYIQISDTLQVQITNEGFYSAREISPLAFKMFSHYLGMLAERVAALSDVSKQMDFKVVTVREGSWEAPVVDIEPGLIVLNGRKLDPGMVDGLVSELAEEFSFTNRRLVEGSLSFSATVTDEIKGVVFDISANEEKILLVPRHRITFEAFLRFYRRITEEVDRTASFDLLVSGADVTGNAT